MYSMKGQVATPIIVAAAIAAAAILAVALIYMGALSADFPSASASVTEQNGVLIASITVLRGSLRGVALIYTAPDGSSWYAKPIYCLGPQTQITAASALFERPLYSGQGATCAFQMWYPAAGSYGFDLVGIGAGGVVSVARGVVPTARANGYSGQLPAGNIYSPSRTPSIGLAGNTYNFTSISTYWPGRGYLAVEVKWGYTNSTCLADGLYISLFAPSNARALVAPSDEGLGVLPFGGADYVPAGSSPQIFLQLNPYDYGLEDGSFEFAVINSSGGRGLVRPTGFDVSKSWPADIWTAYLLYNSSSNTLLAEWIVPGAFSEVYVYNLTDYGLARPPAGNYITVVGVANGGCAANWRVYSYAAASGG
jgi:hypothetical protein